MKLLIISLVILIILTVAVQFTSRHAAELLDGLIRSLEGTSPDDAMLGEQVQGIGRTWERTEKFFSLVLDRHELSTVDSHLAELNGAIRAGNRDLVLVAREKLIAALKRIRTEARPGISHLF